MPPRACTISLGPHFDVAVTMGCGDQCPFIKAVRREDWQFPDPKEMPPPRFREVRDLIEAKVKELMAVSLEPLRRKLSCRLTLTWCSDWARNCMARTAAAPRHGRPHAHRPPRPGEWAADEP